MTILDTIVEEKRREVKSLPRGPVTPERLRLALAQRRDRRDFLKALRQPRRGAVALIAEVKKASPSAGLILPDFEPVRIARDYEAAGATCLSVLTDEKFFRGSLADLRLVRAAVALPVLRKDFIIDERQIREAVDWGADAVLLIVAILDNEQLRSFHHLATQAGLAALVEVHDEAELDRALAAGANLIGVNNRDLRTFKVDLATTERLAGRLRARVPMVAAEVTRRTEFKSKIQNPKSKIPSPPPPVGACLLVAESGIQTRADVERVRRAGAQAILVGESLMRGSDIGAKVTELLGR